MQVYGYWKFIHVTHACLFSLVREDSVANVSFTMPEFAKRIKPIAQRVAKKYAEYEEKDFVDYKNAKKLFALIFGKDGATKDGKEKKAITRQDQPQTIADMQKGFGTLQPFGGSIYRYAAQFHSVS